MSNTKNILLLVGRDDWQKDEALNLVLLNKLTKYNIEIIWEDPAAKVIHHLRKIENKIGIHEKTVKHLNLRIVQIVYGLLNPSYLAYLYKRRSKSVLSRCHSLAKMICKRGIAAQTIILSRSSGGRVASLIADELGIKHIVCLGYPFNHPDHGDEPERYAHLVHLKTPMLIIQGIDDAYGGLEIKYKYAFSENIELSFFKSDHNFDISDAMAHEIVELIERVTGLGQK
ncbi:alpha/beta family hydrolase [Rhodoferax fermentans]|nr:alpha/beta family hydrolase [Rhodoferax fermentans]